MVCDNEVADRKKNMNSEIDQSFIITDSWKAIKETIKIFFRK